MQKGSSQTKFYLKSNNIMPKKAKTTKNSTSKSIKFSNSNKLEQSIHEMSKNLEKAKINLRLLKERLEQRKQKLLNLQGRPIKNKNVEQKEKYNSNISKEKVIHKYNEPIKRKIGKERLIIDAKIKKEKEKEKNENEFERLGEEIDELVENNKLLKKEIQAKRKQKLELEKIKEKMIEENKNKENQYNEMIRRNKNLEKDIKNNNYKKILLEGNQQEINYSIKRDELEKEYQKIVQDYIKKERENLKQKEFNRKIYEMKNGKGNKIFLKNNQNKEIQKELKRLEDEKISDRTPILDELLQRWRIVNKEKKESINKYVKNCTKIREALENLAIYLDLDSISYLPEVFQKTEQRLSNINFQLEKLENEQDSLELEKNKLIKEIELLETKRKGMNKYKLKFLEQKKENIRIIDNVNNLLLKDINLKEKFFQKLQNGTDNFLLKFNETYLSDFIFDKINVDKNKKYNYKTINKYLSNVEDYYNLIQEWNENNNTDNFEIIEKHNFDILREEMKQKLEDFQTKRIMNKSLYNSMNIERKNGKGLNEIIKKTSNIITGQIKSHQNKLTNSQNNPKYKTNNKSKALSQELTEEDGNYRYGNESLANQQSSIIYPNNSSIIKHK